MSAKSNKSELNEEFMVMWRERTDPLNVMSPLYQDKNEKDKSFRSSQWRCSVKKVLLEISQNSQKNIYIHYIVIS